MSILDSKSKKMLVESMRSCVKNILKESAVLTAKQATDKSKFVSEQATYEQLLNVTMNPLRESKYLPDYVLEGAVAILHRACLTGRKHIGVNAITEGALKLHKETGAVITESMLDAALKSVEDGCGLKVVGGILKEAMSVQMTGNVANMLGLNPAQLQNTVLSKNIDAGLYNDIVAKIGRSQADQFVQNINNGQGLKAIERLRDQGMAKGLIGNTHITGDKLNNLRVAAAKRLANGVPKPPVPNPGLVNPDLTAMMQKAKGGGGLGKAALIGGGALALGAAGMHYLNKRNQAQQQQ